MSVIYPKFFTEIRFEKVDLSKISHANVKRNRKFSTLMTENSILSSQVGNVNNKGWYTVHSKK